MPDRTSCRDRRFGRIVCLLVTVLAFVLVLDLELTLGGISGQGGERIGYSSTLEGDVLVQNSNQAIGIKLSDLIILSLFGLSALFLLARARFWLMSRDVLRQFALLAMFVVVGLVALLSNAESYSSAQLVICLAYLAKFAETSLIFLFACGFFRLGGDLKTLLKALLLASAVAAVIGLINPFTGIFFGWLIPDRVQFYGILVLLGGVWLSILLSGYSTSKTLGVSRSTLIALLIVLCISVLLCGKRTVTLGLMASLAYVFLCHLRPQNLGKIVLLTFAVAVISAPFLVMQLDRSFTGESRFLWEGLSQESSIRIADSWLASVPILGLDYSITERFARWLLSVDYFAVRPIIGVGFFGAPYVYGFLPDSSFFQVLLDTGALGTLLLSIFFADGWIVGKRAPSASYAGCLAVGFRGAVIGLAALGLTANAIYIFNLFGVFLILSAVNVHACRPYGRRPALSAAGSQPAVRDQRLLTAHGGAS